MPEIKRKLFYVIVILIFVIVNFHVQNLSIIQGKQFLENYITNDRSGEEGILLGIVVFTVITAIANILLLKKCRIETVRNFLLLTIADTIIIALAVALMILYANAQDKMIDSFDLYLPIGFIFGLFALKEIIVASWRGFRPYAKPLE